MPRRVPRSSNPAHRLYAILQRHAEVASTSPTAAYATIWSTVFEVDGSEVVERIAQAFGLIGEIDRALAVTDDEMQQAAFSRHKEAWSRPFIPSSSGWHQALNGGTVSDDALIALGSIASHLSSELPEGRVPTTDEHQELRAQVSTLIERVVASDLPADMANVILRRLHDVLWALDHVSITGAEGIAAACDRLAVSVAVATSTLPKESEATPDTPEQSELRALFAGLKDFVNKANTIVQVPGAWFATMQTVESLGPSLHDAVRQIMGG